MGFLLDTLAIMLAFYVTFFVLVHVIHDPVFAFGQRMFLQTQLVTMIAWIITLSFLAEYPSLRMTQVRQDVMAVLQINSVALLIFSSFDFVTKIGYFSRLFMGIYFLLVSAIMFLHRYLLRITLSVVRRCGWDTQTRIIVGGGEMAVRYISTAQTNRRFGLKLLGYVEDVPNPRFDVTYLGRIEELDLVLSRHPVDGAVIALNVTDPRVEAAIKVCERQGISMELLLGGLSSKIASRNIRYSPLGASLVLSTIPHTPASLILKRITDFTVSLILIILFSPIYLAVAVAIKLDDRGPIVFKQERIGLRNKPFKIYKFRSMRVNAEALRAQLLPLNEMSGPVFKLTNDPRVTRVGRFIRRTSVDELPQLFNVLIGNMSLVGPRPPLPTEVMQYDHAHRRRLSVKPGITCLWQISGRNNVDFDQWMDLDLTYIDTWSYLGDWKILAKTIPAVLKGGGAR